MSHALIRPPGTFSRKTGEGNSWPPSDGLYAYDLRVVQRHAPDFTKPGERALLDDIIRGQRLIIRWLMPLAVAFQVFSWWLLHAYPRVMLQGHWHLLPIILSLLFSLHYLRGGVLLLRRRESWIVERHAQERGAGS